MKTYHDYLPQSRSKCGFDVQDVRCFVDALKMNFNFSFHEKRFIKCFTYNHLIEHYWFVDIDLDTRENMKPIP